MSTALYRTYHALDRPLYVGITGDLWAHIKHEAGPSGFVRQRESGR
jgi:hypothetical protein